MQAADMAQVMRIQATCYHAIEPESLAAMEAKRVAGAGLACVAQRMGAAADAVDAAIDAYLIAMPVCWPELPALNAEPAPARDANTLYLHDLALHPRVRGTGLGARLLQALLAAAHQRGLHEAVLIAIQGSVPFWQAQGFDCVAPESEALARKLRSYGADAQLMRRG